MLVKTKIPTFFLCVYALLLITELFALIYENKLLEIISKPLLMGLLIIMYLYTSKRKNFYYLTIMVLSLVSDYFFIFRENPNSIVTGIVILIILHLLYIKILTKWLKQVSLYNFLIPFTPCLLSLTLLFFITKNEMGDLFYLLFAHTFLLLVAVNFAFLVYLRSHLKEDLFILIGLFIFMIADCFFALYKFYSGTIIYFIMVDFLYAFAQLLICNSMINKSFKKV